MHPDDETSAEMEALRTQRLWHAYTGSDRRGPRSPLRRGLVASVIVALLASLGAFVTGVIATAGDETAPTTTVPTTSLATTATTSVPPPVTVAVAVDSRQPWTDSGLDVAAGSVVDVAASGSVAHDLFDPSTWVGPDGDPRPEKSRANLVHEGTRLEGGHVGLIGRVGGGTPFLVGSSARLVMPAGGRFFLGVNDNGLDNNEGAFDVILTIAP